MKYMELMRWINKNQDSRKNVFEKLCFDLAKTAISSHNRSVDFNEYLKIFIDYHEVLLINRSSLLFDWFKKMGLDLHEVLKSSLQQSLQDNIQIRSEYLEGLIEVAPHDNFLYYLSTIHFNNHRNDHAIKALKRIKQKDSMCWGIMGQCYLELDKLDKAIECLEFATYMNEKDIYGMFLLSKCYMISKDNKMALFYLAKCWSLRPNNPEIANLYTIASLNQNDFEKLSVAKRFIKQSISNHYPSLLVNGIILGIRMKDNDFIDEIIEKIKPSDIKSAEFADSLSYLLTEINQIEFVDQKLRLLNQLTNPF